MSEITQFAHTFHLLSTEKVAAKVCLVFSVQQHLIIYAMSLIDIIYFLSLLDVVDETMRHV